MIRMAFLCHHYGGEIVGAYELALMTVIGRHPASHIRLNDPTVSGRHAKVSLDVDTANWHLINLSATNGVVCSGRRVDAISLSPGCRFAIALHEFEFLRDVPQILAQSIKIEKSWIPGICFAVE